MQRTSNECGFVLGELRLIVDGDNLPGRGVSTVARLDAQAPPYRRWCAHQDEATRLDQSTLQLSQAEAFAAWDKGAEEFVKATDVALELVEQEAASLAELAMKLRVTLDAAGYRDDGSLPDYLKPWERAMARGLHTAIRGCRAAGALVVGYGYALEAVDVGLGGISYRNADDVAERGRQRGRVSRSCGTIDTDEPLPFQLVNGGSQCLRRQVDQGDDHARSDASSLVSTDVVRERAGDQLGIIARHG